MKKFKKRFETTTKCVHYQTIRYFCTKITRNKRTVLIIRRDSFIMIISADIIDINGNPLVFDCYDGTNDSIYNMNELHRNKIIDTLFANYYDSFFNKEFVSNYIFSLEPYKDNKEFIKRYNKMLKLGKKLIKKYR